MALALENVRMLFESKWLIFWVVKEDVNADLSDVLDSKDLLHETSKQRKERRMAHKTKNLSFDSRCKVFLKPHSADFPSLFISNCKVGLHLSVYLQPVLITKKAAKCQFYIL